MKPGHELLLEAVRPLSLFPIEMSFGDLQTERLENYLEDFFTQLRARTREFIPDEHKKIIYHVLRAGRRINYDAAKNGKKTWEQVVTDFLIAQVGVEETEKLLKKYAKNAQLLKRKGCVCGGVICGRKNEFVIVNTDVAPTSLGDITTELDSLLGAVLFAGIKPDC